MECQASFVRKIFTINEIKRLCFALKKDKEKGILISIKDLGFTSDDFFLIPFDYP